MTASKITALLGGALALFALSLPAARAQVTPPDATPPPTTTTPPASPPDTSTPGAPPNATPATPVVVPDNSGNDTSAPRRSNRFRIGPAVGLFLPTDSKTRDRFGSTWFSIGLGIGPVNSITTKGNYAVDLNLFYHERDGNRAFFAPLGLGYRVALAPGTNAVPYAGLSADVMFADINSKPDNVHNSFQVGGGGSAFVGANFGDSANLELRYYGLSRVKGFDLSGLSLSAGYRF